MQAAALASLARGCDVCKVPVTVIVWKIGHQRIQFHDPPRSFSRMNAVLVVFQAEIVLGIRILKPVDDLPPTPGESKLREVATAR